MFREVFLNKEIIGINDLEEQIVGREMRDNDVELNG